MHLGLPAGGPADARRLMKHHPALAAMCSIMFHGAFIEVHMGTTGNLLQDLPCIKVWMPLLLVGQTFVWSSCMMISMSMPMCFTIADDLQLYNRLESISSRYCAVNGHVVDQALQMPRQKSTSV